MSQASGENFRTLINDYRIVSYRDGEQESEEKSVSPVEFSFADVNFRKEINESRFPLKYGTLCFNFVERSQERVEHSYALLSEVRSSVDKVHLKKICYILFSRSLRSLSLSQFFLGQIEI